MKKQQLQEVRTQTIEKLTEQVKELRVKSMKASMPSLGDRPSNVKVAYNLRKQIAQIMTVITEKKKEAKN